MFKHHGIRSLVPVQGIMVVLAGVAIVTVLLGLVAIHQIQRNSINALNFDYGSSLAEFIATENAETVLLEDWVGTQVIVDGIKNKKILSYLTITDYEHIIRGSTDTSLIGQTYVQPADAKLLNQHDHIRIYNFRTADGDPTLLFTVPIMFKDIEIGQVHLGLTQAPLQNALNLTTLTMVIQLIVIVIAVMVVGYWLALRLSKPLQTLKHSLNEIAIGHHQYRIHEQRKDVFGELYNLCNQIATTLRKMEDEKFGLFARKASPGGSTQVIDAQQKLDMTPGEETQVVSENEPNPSYKTPAKGETEADHSGDITQVASPDIASSSLEMAPENTQIITPSDDLTQIIYPEISPSFLDTSPEQNRDNESNEATQIADMSKIRLSKKSQRHPKPKTSS